MRAKKFKTLSEQREHLVRNKNIIDSDLIESLLKERAYTTVINPYKLFFAKGKNNTHHIYDKNIPIENYITLANIDDNISTLLFKWIRTFERKLKFSLAYNISLYLKQNNSDDSDAKSYIENIQNYFISKDINYLNKTGFDDISIIYTKKGEKTAEVWLIEKREVLLKKILDIALKNTSTNVITTHYQKNHDNIPFWILIHEFSLGDLQLLNNMLIKPLKEKVYKSFHNPNKKNISVANLTSFSFSIESVRKIRNVVCHNESIISYFNSIKVSSVWERNLKALNILKNNSSNSIFSKNIVLDDYDFFKNDFNKNLYDRLESIIRLIK